MLALQCDFRRSEEVNAALDQVVDAFGGLDVAFNNAGVEQAEKPLAELTEDEWDRVLDIDVRRGVTLGANIPVPGASY